MKNVVDSSGWIEYLTKGSNGPIFLPIIRDFENLLVPAITFNEVYKRVHLNMDIDSALLAIGVMSRGQEIQLNREIAIEAALLSVEYKLPMADSLILATARTHNATLWTQNAYFKDIEGVRYIEKK
jgi:predicted nucleic acid-binding protein